MHLALADAADESGSWLDAFSDWAVHLMDTIGPIGAGIAIALESVFPPLPSEIVLPLAGLAAQRGSFTLAEALVWTTVGSLVGALPAVRTRRRLGADRLRRIADRIPLVKGSDVDRSVAWFEKHGGKAVFFGRMIPIFRSLISIPAGVAKMPLWRFGLLGARQPPLEHDLRARGLPAREAWPVVEQYADILQWS